MQQYKNSLNSQQMRSGAGVCQDLGSWLVVFVAVLVRIMVSLCELFWSFLIVFGVNLGSYLTIFSSHNGIEVTWMTL